MVPDGDHHAFHRDGAMRIDGNLGFVAHYYPNSRAEWETRPA